MNDDLIKRSVAIEAVEECFKSLAHSRFTAMRAIEAVPSADRPKHYCAECKYEPIDKRCMPCSSCTNNPKNRDAFVSCEVEKRGASNESI